MDLHTYQTSVVRHKVVQKLNVFNMEITFFSHVFSSG